VFDKSNTGRLSDYSTSGTLRRGRHDRTSVSALSRCRHEGEAPASAEVSCWHALSIVPEHKPIRFAVSSAKVGRMLSFVLGVVLTIAVGVITEFVTGGISRVLRQLRLRWGAKTSISFDVREDGLFMLGEWSPARRLEPHRLFTDITPKIDRPEQPWIAGKTFANAVEKSSAASGDLVYFTGIRLDHRESEETQVCRVRLAESDYPEVLAIERLRIEDPSIFGGLDEVIARDPRIYLQSAVPSSIAINLVPLTSENEILCVERSSAVDSAVGWWTVGVFETMKRSDPNRPGSSEDLYSLATRGLEEELGLRPHEYGEIMISWAGLYRPILRGHIVALMRLRVPQEEVLARAREVHSGYEHSAFEWLHLSRSLVREFVNSPRKAHLGKVGSTIRAEQKTWIEQSRLAVLEVWRFRMMFGD
jgi:hypothetical protein